MTQPEPNGPVVRLCRPKDVAATSKALGIPVSGGPNGMHHTKCGGCNGTGNEDTCPYSIRLREHLDRLGFADD